MPDLKKTLIFALIFYVFLWVAIGYGCVKLFDAFQPAVIKLNSKFQKWLDE